MPNKLYERIIKYLKFKSFYDKKLKNIIFDCLPIGLKNNLISEMYKPIINNFIFFKNFQNTDFIVRVILAFKPIIAYKNDILVNDGDMVKDIIFVAKGVLSIELPINMANQQENIDKYLKSSLLTMKKRYNIQTVGNSTISGNNKKINNMANSVKRDSNKSSFLNSSTISKYTPKFNIKYSMKQKELEEKNIQREKNITYIRIIGIRENEHFGDVLMFLDQKSPLRVRVRSKKSELFFLKKIDAIKISASYQNIWRRINKRSLYNFEQMKKYIKKIVEIYCSVKRSDDENEEIEYDFLNKSSEVYDSNRKSSPKNYNNNSTSKKAKEKKNLKYNKSLMIPKIKYFKLIKNAEINDDKLNFNKINIKTKKKCNSNQILNRNYNLSLDKINKKNSFNSLNTSSLSSSSQISVYSSLNNKSEDKNKEKENKNIQNNIKENTCNYRQKLPDISDENYKLNKGIKNYNENNKKIAKISEKQEQENSKIHSLQFKNSIQKKNKFSSIKRIMTPKNSKKVRFKYKNFNLNNFDIIDNSKDEEEFIPSFDHTINKEIYSGEEEIILNNGNSLLSRKNIGLDYISTKNENSELKKNSIEQKNSILDILLNSLEDKNENKNIFKSLNSSINRISVNTNNFISNKNINIYFENNENIHNKNKKILSSYNSLKEETKKIYWDSNNLSVNNNISIKFDSLYENFNLIGGKEFISNKSLQNQLKEYLLEKIRSPLPDKYMSNILKKTNYFKEPNLYKIKENNLFPDIGLYKRSSKSITMKKTKHEKKHTNKLVLKPRTSKKLNYQSLINENEKNKGLYLTGINKGTAIKSSKRCNSINSNNINSSNKEYQNKIRLPRNIAVINPISRNKKKRDNLLSAININIQKTNQNLNNPDQFYSNYFNSLLAGENNGKNNNITTLFPFKNDMKKKNNIKEKKNKKKIKIEVLMILNFLKYVIV